MFWKIMIPPLYMPSLSPITSIQRSIPDGLGEVHGFYLLAACPVASVTALLFYADSCENCSVFESILHKSVLFTPSIAHNRIFW